MNKRLFLAVTCLLLTLLCLAGCVDYTEQLQKIDKMLQADYGEMDIEVTVSQGSDELTSKFNVVYGSDGSSTVTFEIQRLATFSGDTLPDSYVETYSGTATVKDGNVTSVSGDVPKDVKLAEAPERSLKFDGKYFTNVKLTSHSLTAKVTKPQAFLWQADFSCKPNTMVVAVGFYEMLDYVHIRYESTSGSKVEISYTFTAPQS